MNNSITILMAQINPTVGSISANARKIMAIIEEHQDSHDLILFPELCLTGYPPEDLLLRPAFLEEVSQAVREIAEQVNNCHVILGFPSFDDNHCHNSAGVYFRGKQKALYHKQVLPNYGVFDEQRYFKPGTEASCVFELDGYRFGLCICEDLWQPGPVEQLANSQIDALLCINASPFDYSKQMKREQLLSTKVQQGFPIFYVNLVGGQDELVFDGQSIVVDTEGSTCVRLPAFEEKLSSVRFSKQQIKGELSPLLTQEEQIYNALKLGTRDYIEKNGFPGVLLGLSGGIDSALTLAIAVDALGAERVTALLMPSRYTADMSNEDAWLQLRTMNVMGEALPIEPLFNGFLQTLEPLFANRPKDTTEENIQARIRGVLLMAVSNKTGNLVLTTSNKSETAVGYATLYGDMAGGFSVLKDVLKTQVYELARYRNSISPVIPQRVLERAPSAELAPNQTDQDSLPDYSILDGIIQGFMENNLSAADLIRQGFPEADVQKVIRLIKRNEYKRRQAAPGIKISTRAFGRDWRYPITSG
ncbi:glutamine dependent NAD+ synthetase [Legionella birminghamensis]|uniref:Glutamine-dependent NAD(+) synthetase n=1 Tax=Legionella birminghamensis TaxID=28083 RepID=A0A378I7P2_9GAMM|nr:NAD+ synthase [Legionella birminghamensis]KTC68054.1 glutamine dependent NAD+ synthetase [Legionella birminghamensis]STX31237.1 glutamine dependent NAD+ synthetase [Legionella birminghamensis]